MILRCTFRNGLHLTTARTLTDLARRLDGVAGKTWRDVTEPAALEKPVGDAVAVDEKGEPFRELFLKPKRKLQAQLTIERMTGRAEIVKRSAPDINDRIAVRTPRREEMAFDQDWPSVWPAAATFKESVVPLPVRMGHGRKVWKRPPYKTYGNLELLKIPNFLHLTPTHIERHCAAIKQFCTPFPKELEENPKLIAQHLPLRMSYSDYVHQGNSIRDIRSRIVKMKIKLTSLAFDDHARDKIRRLVGNRYDQASDTITIVTDRCYTRKQNYEYAEYLLTVLYHESIKAEEWEKTKGRADNWKVEFEGSPAETKIIEMTKSAKSEHGIFGELKDAEAEEIRSNTKVKEFAERWYDYRNNPETAKTTRDYDSSVRELLGIPRVTDDPAEVIERTK